MFFNIHDLYFVIEMIFINVYFSPCQFSLIPPLFWSVCCRLVRLVTWLQRF